MDRNDQNTSGENGPSLQFPTRDFLKGFRRIDLIKYCTSIGMKKVWVNKETLIDRMMEKSRQTILEEEENDDVVDENVRLLSTINEAYCCYQQEIK